MNVRDVTGLALASMSDAEQYYELRSRHITDAPDFSDEVLPWLRYLDNARDKETWDHFTARITAEHDAASRGGDIFRAIYPDDAAASARRFDVDADEQDRIDVVLAAASGAWSEDTSRDSTVLDVFLQLVRLAPRWARLPVTHDPNTADWIWSRMRCVLASAGFNNHAALVTELHTLYSLCPLRADETRAEWMDALVEAHKACGWPVQLGQVPWKEWCGALAPVEVIGYIFTDWHHVVALLHILKHIRLDDETNALTTLYRTIPYHTDWPAPGKNIIPAKLFEPFLPLLGIPLSTGKKLSHPLRLAFTKCFGQMATIDFLRRQSTTRIPGLYLHGPWSTVRADPAEQTGFIQHGVKLDGVWQAYQRADDAPDGVVEPFYGIPASIVGYQWNLSTAGSQELLDSRARLERIMPATYVPGFASDLFWDAFPNLVMPDGTDEDAVKAIFDAPIVASLLRADVPGLALEYPFIAFLPQTPTLDESTNQGKSYAALTYARMLSPGLEKVVRAINSSSAPDSRAFADVLRTYGTAALDEFQLPRSPGHVLSRDLLQSLITGSSVTSGKALENSGSVSLRHSLVCAAKALDFEVDLINRSFCFYLSDLTDEHRNAAQRIADIQSGALSMLARLQMLAFIIDRGLLEKLQAEDHVSTAAGMRFGVHRALARLLYAERTGRADTGEVDETFRVMRERLIAHRGQAIDSGVFASIEGGKSIAIRPGDYFADLTDADLQIINAKVNESGEKHEGVAWLHVAKLMDTRTAIAGLSHLSPAEAVGKILGTKTTGSRRILAMGFARELKNAIQPGARLRLNGGNWYLHRMDGPNGLLVRLEERAP